MQWRCEWCGRNYESDEPPATCETCGRESFEADTDDDPFESEQIVWACADCGREHVKHSPPCARCGGHNLERQRVTVDVDEDVSAPGYLSVGAPYLLGALVVVVIVGLALVGVIPVPGLSGPPAPPDAPADEERTASLSLAEVEANLHDRFETERDSEGVQSRTLDGGDTGAFVTYLTRHTVAERYDDGYDGDGPDPSAFDIRCQRQPAVGVFETAVDADAFNSESALADELATAMLDVTEYRSAIRNDAQREGISVHVAPDGTVFVGYLSC
ncbi:uncharacterized protein NP_4160A [Natronomonas pharaonis DSM 2160]|uniref:Uncharacterized protein n=1 Tax=Natronomonas pharaonis (strain ATCC 35678 / DSM 2160 / CIP 103997 / JCM 8858 / NBRC 14720 / NCIMB 2260 / Gabara) TaxID=348780 RepID=A0A1U7EY82_NATPD|nr:hypothetical protein [Natronomonas pharaonis]CAI50171.1 uncharacterized protein NP_4160A [Natronomonas pharaonis DSM 2160]